MEESTAAHRCSRGGGILCMAALELVNGLPRTSSRTGTQGQDRATWSTRVLDPALLLFCEVLHLLEFMVRWEIFAEHRKRPGSLKPSSRSQLRSLASSVVCHLVPVGPQEAGRRMWGVAWVQGVGCRLSGILWSSGSLVSKVSTHHNPGPVLRPEWLVGED